MNNNPNNNTNNCPEKELSVWRKIKYSFYSALIFFFVSSPIMYQLMNRLYGHYFMVSDANGCPSNSGLLLHTFIFFIIIFTAMNLG
jgi:hypothetical protein